jgi:hypothetical protein
VIQADDISPCDLLPDTKAPRPVSIEALLLVSVPMNELERRKHDPVDHVDDPIAGGGVEKFSADEEDRNGLACAVLSRGGVCAIDADPQKVCRIRRLSGRRSL